MGKIIFTQYVRPNGTKKLVEIERPEDICQKAQLLMDKGWRLEVENLGTEVHVEMCLLNEDEDYEDTEGDIVLNNGRDIFLAVDRIINKVYEKETTGKMN